MLIIVNGPLPNRVSLARNVHHPINMVFPSRDSHSSTYFHCLFLQYKKHGSLYDIHLDDYAGYSRVEGAMKKIGLDDKEKMNIFRVVAGVMHLGNVKFEASEGTQGKKSETNLSFLPKIDATYSIRNNSFWFWFLFSL